MKSIADLARVVAIVCVVIVLLLLKVARFTWVHRKQIAAGCVAAAIATYAAGRICRQELEDISARAAQLVHSEPLPALPALPALAPILAPLAALREALERYLARVYPPAVAG
jgi:hypothetical protein